jgi:prevent-host-death family protein
MAGQIRQTVLQVTQLHRQLGKIIRRVARSDEHFVVEKGGLPVAVMMSMTAYEELVGEQRLAEFERHARALGEEA